MNIIYFLSVFHSHPLKSQNPSDFFDFLTFVRKKCASKKFKSYFVRFEQLILQLFIF